VLKEYFVNRSFQYYLLEEHNDQFYSSEFEKLRD